MIGNLLLTLLNPCEFPRPPPCVSTVPFSLIGFDNVCDVHAALKTGPALPFAPGSQKERMVIRRYVFWFVALGVAGYLGQLQGWLVEAGTITGGTAVTLGGVDSFANTVQSYLKGNVGKMLAMILAIAGIAMVVAGKMALGISGLGSGIAIAFIPNIIGDAFDATAADPIGGMTSFVPWAAGDGVLNLLAQAGFVLLWPVVPVMKYGQDPVVLAMVGLVFALRPTWVYAGARSVAGRMEAFGHRAWRRGVPCRVG